MTSRQSGCIPSLDFVQEKLRLLAIERHQLQSRLSQLEVEVEEQRHLLTISQACEQAPISRLPPEILLHVFFYSVSLDDHGSVLGSDRHPLIISHVCQKWRYLSLAASDLWTSLVFNNPSTVHAFALRSKERPVDVIHVPETSVDPVSPVELYRPLVTTRKRWRSVFWEGTLERVRSLLLVLNYDKTVFSHLHTLDLRVKARDSPCKPILVQTFCSVHFPQLSRLFLSGISPSELPPTTAQCIRLLHVHFPVSSPYPSNPLLPPYFRMSSFCAYLLKAPQLETLVLEDCTPLTDVYLHPDHGRHAALVSSSVTPIRAALPISAVALPNVRRFDWTSAPPKDLWRLFHFLTMPALHQLDLSLGKLEDRWFAVQERNIAPMLSSHPLSLHPVNLLLEFNALQELRVTCCDAEGLSCSLRKMSFPVLSKLELFFDETLGARGSPARKAVPVSCPKLPPLESMFREPRLVKLAQLTLYGFTLEMSTTTAMLAYMPGLEQLHLDSCKGTTSISLHRVTIVTSSFPGADIDSPAELVSTRDADKMIKKWTCARLELLAIEHCPNLKFRWLQHLFVARKRSAEAGSAPTSRAIRPLPGARKNGQSNAGAPLTVTPCKSNMAQRAVDSPSYPFMSSPNGSFVAGWNPHEPVQPVMTLTLRVEDCRRISAAEVMSLQGKKYGIVDTIWKP